MTFDQKFYNEATAPARKAYDPASGRFIKSGNVSPKEGAVKQKTDHYGGGGSDDGLNLDPLLIALLKKIPGSDAKWPAAQRIRWLMTFAMNVSQIYDTEDDPVEIEIKPGKVDDSP